MSQVSEARYQCVSRVYIKFCLKLSLLVLLREARNCIIPISYIYEASFAVILIKRSGVWPTAAYCIICSFTFSIR